MPTRVVTRQKGISPKLLADLITSAIIFVLLAVVGDVDEATSAAIAKVVGFAVGFAVRPGTVEEVEV